MAASSSSTPSLTTSMPTTSTWDENDEGDAPAAAALLPPPPADTGVTRKRQAAAAALLLGGVGSDDDGGGGRRRHQNDPSAPRNAGLVSYSVSSAGPRVEVALLYELIWRRVCVEPHFYSQMVRSPSVGTMFYSGEGALQRYVLADEHLPTGVLELLLSATLLHLAQLGTTPVSVFTRMDAQCVLLALLQLDQTTLASLALHEATGSVLAPLLAMRQYVSPTCLLNALMRAVRYVYCQEMLTFTPSTSVHGETVSKTHTAPHGLITTVQLASHPTHPFLYRQHPLDSLSMSRLCALHLASPLCDLRVLRNDFYHDITLSGYPTFPHAKESAVTINTYRDIGSTTHRDRGILSLYRRGKHHALNRTDVDMNDLTRPQYNSDYWTTVSNTLLMPWELSHATDRPLMNSGVPVAAMDYLSQPHRALLWLRIMPDDMLYSTEQSNDGLSSEAIRHSGAAVFAGDLRTCRFMQAHACDAQDAAAFILRERYTNWFVALFEEVLAIWLDSTQPFGQALGCNTVHVLHSAGGQAIEACTRFEQAVFMTLQCFEQPGAVTSLFSLASSCVASVLHASTQRAGYSPSMYAVERFLSLSAPSHYSSWFADLYRHALLRVRADNHTERHSLPMHLSSPPPSPRPPHLHVMVALAETLDDATLLYETPQYAVESGIVRMARLELTDDVWRSLAPLLPTPTPVNPQSSPHNKRSS